MKPPACGGADAGGSVQGMTDGVRGSQELRSGSLFFQFQERRGDCPEPGF